MKTPLILTLPRVCDLLVQLASRNPSRTKGLEYISCMCAPPISTGAVFSDLLQSSRWALLNQRKDERSARLCPLGNRPYFASPKDRHLSLVKYSTVHCLSSLIPLFAFLINLQETYPP